MQQYYKIVVYAVMLQRYFQIEEHLCNIKDVECMMPGTRATRNLKRLCESFSQLDYVAKELQKSSTTLAGVRALFDAVMEDYSKSDHSLSINAKVVHNPEFESGIVKILNNHVADLTATEMDSVQCLKMEHVASFEAECTTSVSDNLSIAARARKKSQISMVQMNQYVDPRFILPTTNICERLFSVAGNALSDRRQGILPANFEKQMFLKVNQELWG